MKYRMLIVFSVVLLVVAGVAVVLLRQSIADAPPTGKGSYVDFEIREVPPSIWPASDEKPDREAFEKYKRNLAALVKAPFVISKALDDRSVQELPLVKLHGEDVANWLAHQIVVKFPDDGDVMEIGVINSDQHQASAIVQALANAFQREVVEADRTSKLQRRDQLDKKYRVYHSNLLDKQRQLFQLEQATNPPSAASGRLQRQSARLERLVGEADRAEMQAELQIARGKHKLDDVAAATPERNAIQSEIDLAEVDRKFWSGKSAALLAQMDETANEIAASKKFSGDADQMRIQIAQLQNIVNEMGNTLTKWNVELDAEPRIVAVGAHSD